MRRYIVTLSAASAALLAILLLAAWASLGFDASGIGVHGWVALGLGVVLTCGLAIALMTAVFASARGGYDTRASGRPEGNG